MARCKETINYPNGPAHCARQEHSDIFHEFVIDPAPQPEIKLPDIDEMDWFNV